MHLPPAPNFWQFSPGKHLAWSEFGDPSGHPVFYHHGWPSSRLQAALAHSLAKERGLRLIAMDRPGMGRSTFEPRRRLDSWPALMESFADHLGIGRFSQLGVSGGAPYVLACAARMPDRLTGSAVLAGAVPLAEITGGPHGLHPLYQLLIPFRKLPAALFSPLFRAASLATRMNPARFPLSLLMRSLPPEDRHLLTDSPELWNVIARSFREGVRQGGRGVMADADIYFQPLPFDIQSIRHPVRYWHGGNDRNIPLSAVREFTARIPGARLETDDSLGHFSLAWHMAPAALDHLAERARSA